MSQHPEEPASCADKLMCSLCRRRFTREKDFKAHENLHLSGKELFQCKECGFCYSNKSFLTKHIDQKCRTIQTPAKSNIADKIDKATSIFEKHIEKAQDCQESVIAQKVLESQENRFQCKICGRTLCGAKDLKIHYNLHASGKKPFSCKYCGSCYWDNNKKFTSNHERKCRKKKSRMDSQKHDSQQITPTVDKPASFHKQTPTSPQGNASRRSSSRLSKPLKRYGAPITSNHYQCDVCNKTFMAENNLKIHKQLHGDKSNKTESPTGNEICDDINSLISNILKVDDTHSTSQEPKTTSGNIQKRSDAVICLICSREFKETFKLENHVELHESGKKPLDCHTCGWCFWTKKARQEHLRSHETITHIAEGSEFRCHLCNRQFKQAISLDTHVQLYTTGKKPLSCKVCGWHFWSRQALDGHEMSHIAHHPPENLPPSIAVQGKAKRKDPKVPGRTQNNHIIENIIEIDAKNGLDKTGNCYKYPCLVCGRRLQDPKHLKYHEFLHTTNKKPLECRLCGHCYFEPASLQYHVKSCSRKVDAKAVKDSSQYESKGNIKDKSLKQSQPFKCSFSNRKFRGPNKLKVHENLHARGNDALSCQVCGAQYKDRSKDQFKKHQTICRAKENYKRRSKIPKEFKCEKCSKAYRDQDRLRKHEAKHDYTGRRTSSRRVSKAEKYLIHQAPTKFSCSLCKKQFIGAKNLKIHMELHGSSASAAVATDVPEEPSDSVWEERNDLSVMAEEPSEQEPPPRLMHVTTKRVEDFDCLACGREFANAIKLRAHLQLHESEETPYVCPLCNWCFWNETDLRAHDHERHSSLTKKLKDVDDDTSPQHSGSKNMPEELDTISLDSSNHQSCLDTPSKVLTCEGCKQCFWSERQLELHQLECDIESQDPEDYLDFEEDNKPFHCVTCNTFFATLSQLELHEATHKINQGQ